MKDIYAQSSTLLVSSTKPAIGESRTTVCACSDWQSRDGAGQTHQRIPAENENAQVGKTSNRFRKRGELVVPKMQLAQPVEAPHRGRNLLEPVIGGAQLDQANHARHHLGPRGERVLADVEIAKAHEPRETRRQRGEPVVVKVQEPIEVDEFAQAFWKLRDEGDAGS